MEWQKPAIYLLLSYWTVFAAELVGDRSIYTVTSLALRFRPARVYCGITLAFLGKMLVAVLFGSLLSRLPLHWASAVSAACFFATAFCLGFKRLGPPRSEPETMSTWRGAVTVSFAAVFFSEWADLGQLSAAALVAKYQAPLSVWLGGSLALCTKGILAMTLGLYLRRRVPADLARAVSVTSCLVLGFASLYEILPRG